MRSSNMCMMVVGILTREAHSAMQARQLQVDGGF